MIGLSLSLFFIPRYLAMREKFPYRNPLHFALDLTWSLFFDLCLLIIILFIYAFFSIKPINTLKGKKKLLLTVLIFGNAFMIFPIFQIIYFFHYLLGIFYTEHGYAVLFGLVFNLILLIPGLICLLSAQSYKDNLYNINRI